MQPLSHAALAALCSRAYNELSGISSELEFLVHREGDISYIAIRGTEASSAWQHLRNRKWKEFIGDFSDIVRDMRVAPRYHPATSWGHGGFITGGEVMAKAIELHESITTNLVLTGHSLGAAVAVVASQILAAKGYEIDEVVLFGCPRIYALFRPHFDYRVTSYRYGSDIVTNVPRIYRQPVDLVKLEPNRRLANMGDHWIENYEDALRRLESAKA